MTNIRRSYSPISVAHLRAKLVDAFGVDDGNERPIDVRKMYDRLKKDIPVKFDLENSITDPDKVVLGMKEIVGFHQIKKGPSFYGILSGGDWEVPVFWIVYWNGKYLRAWVPEEGNVYNRKTLKAFGNEEEESPASAPLREPERIRMDIIYKLYPSRAARRKR